MAGELVNVVSGCPRSGTSLMMTILHAAFGAGRIYGNQFPDGSFGETNGTVGGDADRQREYLKYLDSLFGREQNGVDAEKIHDMNPDGFWESKFTTSGIRYKRSLDSDLSKLLSMDGPFAKVVSQGLANSDPRHIGKVIFMVRHPRSVAKSQERLDRRTEVMTEDRKIHDLFGDEVVHSPQMFINATISAMRWLRDHPVPVHMVMFDELIDNPHEVLRGVREFIGEDGDWEAAEKVVKKSLRRSYPEDRKSNLWADAEYVYDALLAMDFDAIDRFVSDVRRQTNRDQRGWMCARMGIGVSEDICNGCMNNGAYRRSLIKYAESVGSPWRDVACAFEVAYDLDNPLVSIEESIANNRWLEEEVQ